MSAGAPWLLYGANGYTGELVAREAARRGLAPVLAGRNAAAVAALAAELGLPHRAFGLDDPAALRRGLDGVAAVLHCAGPFVRTSAPLVAACLAERRPLPRHHRRDRRLRGRPGAGRGGAAGRRRAAARRRLRRRPQRLPGGAPGRGAPRRGRAGARLLRRRHQHEPRHAQDHDRGAAARRRDPPRRPDRAGAAGLGRARDPLLLRQALGDDDRLGRRLDRLPLDRHPQHPRLLGHAAEGDPPRAASPPAPAAPRPPPGQELPAPPGRAHGHRPRRAGADARPDVPLGRGPRRRRRCGDRHPRDPRGLRLHRRLRRRVRRAGRSRPRPARRLDSLEGLRLALRHRAAVASLDSTKASKSPRS